ncbi:MAG: Smr/MutS family protein [Crocinitomicaceae bacterium]|nr:Smr/MutS family protein [Crocinitomicaceae bacterium]
MKVGDKVSVILEDIKGTVISVDGAWIEIEDEDGFPRKYKTDQLVLNQNVDYRYNIHDLKDKIDVDKKHYEISVKSNDKYKTREFWEIDLHIDQLIEHHSHLSNTEIVTKQMSVFKSFFERARHNGIKKCVVIHGKGKGVLKAEIIDYLRKEKELGDYNIDFLDASFAEYGYGGATEINIY